MEFHREFTHIHYESLTAFSTHIRVLTYNTYLLNCTVLNTGWIYDHTMVLKYIYIYTGGHGDSAVVKALC
jgi:hypothetical protein